MPATRASSAPRKRRPHMVGSPEKIAPGFTTAADLEAEAEAEAAELTAVGAPAPRTPLGAAIAAVFSVVDAILSVPFKVLLLSFDLFYNGVQAVLVPVCKLVPRTIFGVDVFTANTITFGRLFLVVPVAIGLASGAEPLLPAHVQLPEWAAPSWLLPGVPNARLMPGALLAAVLILIHDFLDHLDGIVAKAQREAGTAAGDDAMFGGFIDAFIDKCFFAITVWSALLCSDLPAAKHAVMLALGAKPAALGAGQSTLGLECALVSGCVVLVAYEVCIATVRVNDYFTEKLAPPPEAGRRRRLRAAMEGKLKQKLTSFGLALLALAVPRLANPLLVPWAGWGAAGLLWLACYMAHKSLALKLAAYPGWEGWLPAGTAEPA